MKKKAQAKTEKKVNRCSSDWTTGNEVAYLHGLVTGQHFTGMASDHVCMVSREELLRNYIRSAKRRKESGTFGLVDPRVVIAEAQEILEKVSMH